MNILNLFIDPFVKLLPKLPGVLMDIIIGYVIIKIILWFFKKALKLTNLPRLQGILLSLANFVLWVMLIVFIANNLGFDKFAVAITGSFVVLAFILNNGMAPLISDIFSAIFLCTDPDFKVGSRIRIGNGEGMTEGILKSVDMRKVRIKDDDGNIIVVPNSLTDKEKWIVLEKVESKPRYKEAKEAIKNKLNKAKKN